MLCGIGYAQTVAVGTASAAPGQRATGMIAVAAAWTRRWTSRHRNQWRETGPKLALLAGAHGTEYASIIALEKLAQTADPAALSGTLIIVRS